MSSCFVMSQEYSEAEAASAMKRMVQHHAANGWGDDAAQPVDVPTTDDSQPAADGVEQDRCICAVPSDKMLRVAMGS